MKRALGISVLALLAAAAPAGAATFTPGAPGAGDPFFPLAGNGGYDVGNYSLRLDFEPQNNALDARAVISARATQDLSRFDLDLRGLHVGKVTVDGTAAGFTRDGQELVITPAAGIRKGRGFEVAVAYDGHPNPVIDPDKSKDGWIPTDDGAFVVNEPQGSPSWYPANDTPKDKATYDFAITVPKGRTAIANGLLLGTTDNGATTTWRWRASDPTAPYLATATSGIFETRFGTLPSGLPEYSAVDPQTRQFGSKDPNPQLAWQRLAFTGPAVALFTELYGAYPFESVGGVVDWAPNVFYSLESQTRPMYWVIPSELTVVHEVAHMWFGDSLTPELWPDIWLNEGFATLVGVDLVRAQRRQERGAELRRAVRDPRGLRRRPGPLVPRAGRAARARGDVPHAGLRPRRDDAPGPAREGRRRRVLRDPPQLVRGEPQRQRHDGRFHRARRARQRAAARPLLRRLAVRGGEAGQLVAVRP
jgi:hypothetical protein